MKKITVLAFFPQREITVKAQYTNKEKHYIYIPNRKKKPTTKNQSKTRQYAMLYIYIILSLLFCCVMIDLPLLFFSKVFNFIFLKYINIEKTPYNIPKQSRKPKHLNVVSLLKKQVVNSKS